MRIYTDEHLEYVETLQEKDKKKSQTKAIREMCVEFGMVFSDSLRRAVSKRIKNKKDEEALEKSSLFQEAQKMQFDRDKNTFIIAWAQNATPVHSNLFKNILAYSEARDAGLHIIAGRYKNPTSIFSDEDYDWWSDEVRPYLDANRHNLHKHLQVLSDVKVSPTASTPLSGLNGITGLESCIIGHPRQHLKTLPVLEGYPHKLLLSTGACTVSNYTDSKAGKKGEFHHALGFIIVELDGDDFHIRQVSADDEGNFYDLFHRVKDGKVYDNGEGCEAAILGDIHIQHNNKEATELTFELLDIMKPKHTMIHDIIDCESISHWDMKDPFRMMQKEEEGTDNLYKEKEDMLDWLEKYKHHNLVVVRSNHDDFFDRWLKFSDWRKVGNKKLYLEGANILANEPVAKKKGVIPWYIHNRFGDEVKTLGLDDSYRVLGWELAMHGHLGASGSRGSHTQFKGINTKNVTAHVHHPHKEDGHCSVGTLTHLRVNYTKGLNTWMHSNGLIYPDGKFQHIHIINGKYCRDMR
tara:strand:- start:137 stop:1702 length:1566 start_codon:yes stop_codon:yes gene_type:complete